jgi:hypothetical protein
VISLIVVPVLSLGIATLAIVVAVGAMKAEVVQADAASGQAAVAITALNEELRREQEDKRSAELRDWQAFVVFSIIDKGFEEQKFASGLTFDEIRARYVQEAGTITSIEISKRELQPDALQRILFGLLTNQRIYKTHDGRFASQRSELLPGFGRQSPMEAASFEILSLVSAESGKHTKDSLQGGLADKYHLTTTEYRYVIANLISLGFVESDGDGKLYPVVTKKQAPR